MKNEKKIRENREEEIKNFIIEKNNLENQLKNLDRTIGDLKTELKIKDDELKRNLIIRDEENDMGLKEMFKEDPESLIRILRNENQRLKQKLKDLEDNKDEEILELRNEITRLQNSIQIDYPVGMESYVGGYEKDEKEEKEEKEKKSIKISLKEIFDYIDNFVI